MIGAAENEKIVKEILGEILFNSSNEIPARKDSISLGQVLVEALNGKDERIRALEAERIDKAEKYRMMIFDLEQELAEARKELSSYSESMQNLQDECLKIGMEYRGIDQELKMAHEVVQIRDGIIDELKAKVERLTKVLKKLCPIYIPAYGKVAWLIEVGEALDLVNAALSGQGEA